MIECGPQIYQRATYKRGQQKAKGLSPYEEMIALLPSFYAVPLLANACELESPITGLQSPVHKKNALVMLFHKGCYERAPEEAELLLMRKVKRPANALWILDHECEGKEYGVMHGNDQRDLIFKASLSPAGMAYVARLADAPKGRGDARYINDVVDLAKGVCPTATGAAGYSWVVCTLNGIPQVRRTTNREIARGYLARDLEESWLKDDSVLGEGVLGNMLPQNVPDAAMTQLALLHTKVQPDGKTAQEKWLSGAVPASACSFPPSTTSATKAVDAFCQVSRDDSLLANKAAEAREERSKPCLCPTRCAAAWSDTVHGSHGFSCAAVYEAFIKRWWRKAQRSQHRLRERLQQEVEDAKTTRKGHFSESRSSGGFQGITPSELTPASSSSREDGQAKRQREGGTNSGKAKGQEEVERDKLQRRAAWLVHLSNKVQANLNLHFWKRFNSWRVEVQQEANRLRYWAARRPSTPSLGWLMERCDWDRAHEGQVTVRHGPGGLTTMEILSYREMGQSFPFFPKEEKLSWYEPGHFRRRDALISGTEELSGEIIKQSVPSLEFLALRRTLGAVASLEDNRNKDELLREAEDLASQTWEGWKSKQRKLQSLIEEVEMVRLRNHWRRCLLDTLAEWIRKLLEQWPNSSLSEGGIANWNQAWLLEMRYRVRFINWPASMTRLHKLSLSDPSLKGAFLRTYRCGPPQRAKGMLEWTWMLWGAVERALLFSLFWKYRILKVKAVMIAMTLGLTREKRFAQQHSLLRLIRGWAERAESRAHSPELSDSSRSQHHQKEMNWVQSGHGPETKEIYMASR